MAENIEIKVQDKVAPSISNKLKAIAADARGADSAIKLLQSSLKSISASSGLQRLQTELSKTAIRQQKLATETQKTQAAMAGVEAALNRAVAAEARANAALAQLAAAQSKASVEAQKLATEQQKTAAAATQAQTALTQLAVAQANNASASQRLATAQQQTTTATANAAAATTRAATASAQGQTAAQNLAAATARAGTAQTQGATAAQRLASAQHQTAAAAANAASAQTRAALSAQRLAQAQQQAASASNSANLSLGSFLRTAAGGLSIAVLTNYTLGAAEAFTVLQNKLQNVTTSQAQVIVLTEELFNVADRTRSNVEATATAFTRFDRSLKQMGKSQEESLRMTETINKALIVGGANATEAASALLQLSQGFNAGKLQGDEFRAVAENMPMVLDAVATVLKKPINEIKELASEGKITSEVLFNAFKSIEKSVDDTFAKTTPTMTQAFTVLNNGVTEYIGNADKAIGFTSALSEIVLLLAGEFNTASDELKETNAQTTVMHSLFSGALEVLKVVIVVASDVVFVFKMVGVEIGAIAAQLAALARMDFDGFNAISQSVKEDAARARRELDEFQARIMKVELKPSPIVAPASTQLRQKGPNLLGPSVDKTAAKTAENRALALKKVNAQLDNELSRTFQLAPLREAQAKFDQIEESFIQRKIKLSSSEVASIKEKIKAIQDATEVQKQFDSIYGDAVGPLKEYNATQEAAIKLLAMGAITQEQYSRAITKSSEAYADSKDPMRQYNRDLQQQFDLLNLLPKQREIEQQVMQVKNDLLAKGVVLNEQELTQLREKLVLLQQLNGVAQQEASLLDGSVGKRQQQIDQIAAINKLLADRSSGFTKSDALTAISGTDAGQYLVGSPEMINAQVEQLGIAYGQIDALRQADLISEETAAAAKMQIWSAQQNVQLSTAKTFFGSLEGLQSSSNKKLAAIGKAAAITNAVINTYQSATGAYAAMASIPFVGPALGVAAAAAAVAAGMANVAAIRSQNTGFMAGGYTGNMARDEVAGVVHGKEFVMDAEATSRIGVGNLEALQRGAAGVRQNSAAATAPPAPAMAEASRAGDNTGGTTNLRVINALDPSIIGDFLATPEGEQVFVNTIRRNASSIKQTISNA